MYLTKEQKEKIEKKQKEAQKPKSLGTRVWKAVKIGIWVWFILTMCTFSFTFCAILIHAEEHYEKTINTSNSESASGRRAYIEDNKRRRRV